MKISVLEVCAKRRLSERHARHHFTLLVVIYVIPEIDDKFVLSANSDVRAIASDTLKTCLRNKRIGEERIVNL